jgi:hypothetical protein
MTSLIYFILIETVDYLITVLRLRVLIKLCGSPEITRLVLLVSILVYVDALMIIARQWLPGYHVGILICHHLALIVAQEDIVDSPDLARIVLCCSCLVLQILIKSFPYLRIFLPILRSLQHLMLLPLTRLSPAHHRGDIDKTEAREQIEGYQ